MILPPLSLFLSLSLLPDGFSSGFLRDLGGRDCLVWVLASAVANSPDVQAGFWGESSSPCWIPLFLCSTYLALVPSFFPSTLFLCLPAPSFLFLRCTPALLGKGKKKKGQFTQQCLLLNLVTSGGSSPPNPSHKEHPKRYLGYHCWSSGAKRPVWLLTATHRRISGSRPRTVWPPFSSKVVNWQVPVCEETLGIFPNLIQSYLGGVASSHSQAQFAGRKRRTFFQKWN